MLKSSQRTLNYLSVSLNHHKNTNRNVQKKKKRAILKEEGEKTSKTLMKRVRGENDEFKI